MYIVILYNERAFDFRFDSLVKAIKFVRFNVYARPYILCNDRLVKHNL